LDQIEKGENDRTWVINSLKAKGCMLPE
ncbi:RraA family protein, partial [Acinetobacter soli]